jgi:hypothetical protein
MAESVPQENITDWDIEYCRKESSQMKQVFAEDWNYSRLTFVKEGKDYESNP